MFKNKMFRFKFLFPLIYTLVLSVFCILLIYSHDKYIDYMFVILDKDKEEFWNFISNNFFLLTLYNSFIIWIINIIIVLISVVRLFCIKKCTYSKKLYVCENIILILESFLIFIMVCYILKMAFYNLA